MRNALPEKREPGLVTAIIDSVEQRSKRESSFVTRSKNNQGNWTMTNRKKPKRRDTIRSGTYGEKTNLKFEHKGELVSIRVLSARDGRARLSVRFLPLPPERCPKKKLEVAVQSLPTDERKDVSEIAYSPW